MNRHRIFSIALSAWIAVALLCGQPAAAQKKEDEPGPAVRDAKIQKQVDKRLEWFKHDKFGMFIHWGVWSNPAGVWEGKPTRHFTEWLQYHAGLPWEKYRKLAKEFNPTRFDADYWVRMAKRAGMKYIVITSKHHDGFAIFHSKVTEYDIEDASPYKPDPLKELAKACKKHDIRLGFYYSHCVDWSHPGGYRGGAKLARSRKDDMSLDWNKNGEIDHEDYVKGKSLPQVRELLTNYGDMAIIWFDIARFGVEYPKMFHDMIHEIQPDCLINSRIVEGSDGTPEHPNLYDYYSMGDYKTNPPAGGMYWESTISMHGSYGVDHRPGAEKHWRSTDRLLRQLVKCIAHNGNYLLNIGPEGDGSLNEPTVERLKAMGQWMDSNSEAIYGTSPMKSAIKGFNGESVCKDKRIYLHVFRWPENGMLNIGNVPVKVEKASILNGRARVEFEQDGESVKLSNLPWDKDRPDKVGHTVIVLHCAKAPDVRQ